MFCGGALAVEPPPLGQSSQCRPSKQPLRMSSSAVSVTKIRHHRPPQPPSGPSRPLSSVTVRPGRASTFTPLATFLGSDSQQEDQAWLCVFFQEILSSPSKPNPRSLSFPLNWEAENYKAPPISPKYPQITAELEVDFIPSPSWELRKKTQPWCPGRPSTARY